MLITSSRAAGSGGAVAPSWARRGSARPALARQRAGRRVPGAARVLPLGLVRRRRRVSSAARGDSGATRPPLRRSGRVKQRPRTTASWKARIAESSPMQPMAVTAAAASSVAAFVSHLSFQEACRVLWSSRWCHLPLLDCTQDYKRHHQGRSAEGGSHLAKKHVVMELQFLEINDFGIR